jgi:hypothetical protein
MANEPTEIVPSASALKNPYRKPTLVVFGEVAALTQSASGCSMSDSPSCLTDPGAMGPMA